MEIKFKLKCYWFTIKKQSTQKLNKKMWKWISCFYCKYERYAIRTWKVFRKGSRKKKKVKKDNVIFWIFCLFKFLIIIEDLMGTFKKSEIKKSWLIIKWKEVTTFYTAKITFIKDKKWFLFLNFIIIRMDKEVTTLNVDKIIQKCLNDKQCRDLKFTEA